MFVLSLSPGFRCRFTPACGLSALGALLPPPFQGLNVCFVLVTGVALSLHPGLCSASPSGLLPPLLPGLLLSALRAYGFTLGSVVEAAQLLADGGEQAVDVAGPDSQQNVKVKTFD